MWQRAIVVGTNALALVPFREALRRDRLLFAYAVLASACASVCYHAVELEHGLAPLWARRSVAAAAANSSASVDNATTATATATATLDSYSDGGTSEHVLLALDRLCALVLFACVALDVWRKWRVLRANAHLGRTMALFAFGVWSLPMSEFGRFMGDADRAAMVHSVVHWWLHSVWHVCAYAGVHVVLVAASSRPRLGDHLAEAFFSGGREKRV